MNFVFTLSSHKDILSDFSMGVSVGGHTMEGALCWFPSDDPAGARGIALGKKKNLYSVICNKVHLFGFVFSYTYLMSEYVKYMPSSEF